MKKLSRETRRLFAFRGRGENVVTPGAIDRWMSLELGKLNAGLVVERRSLNELRKEPHPACRTREGTEHTFDPVALDRLARTVTAEEAKDLRLPITLFAGGDVVDSAYLSDELAARALHAQEGYGTAFPFRNGRMYLAHSLAVALVRRRGGTIQLAFG